MIDPLESMDRLIGEAASGVTVLPSRAGSVGFRCCARRGWASIF